MTKEKQRTIPEKELLLEKSRKEAMNGNYDKAIEHREKAKQIADETIAQRIVQVDNLFNQSRDKLMAQFKAAITELQTRFESELRSHEDKKEKAFDQKKTILENQIAIFIQKSLKDIAKDKLFDDRKSAYVYIQPIISSFLENRGIEFPDSSLIQSQATSARTS
ncbi:hypothetical protein GPJ56_010970 [Histomonas meleagridis]|uniref:uncharacterized protein n=1 Tax=Histomonas meleagridis TaxID=135588 RepID=UPI00355A4D7D|nr:hypothetical protein GPJ56_010970 [Histomonas meleagridis]KAH0800747.1 hypothetical protein GO595_006500 [Histomonas meleagridis]